MDGVFARIPLAEVTISEAMSIVEDGSFYETTRLPILHAFSQIRLEDYWSLTVADHLALAEYLGLV